MNSKAPIKKTRGGGNDALGSEPWFTTLSVLDVGGAISSSQFQRLVASFTKLWRRTIGRPVWWRYGCPQASSED